MGVLLVFVWSIIIVVAALFAYTRVAKGYLTDAKVIGRGRPDREKPGSTWWIELEVNGREWKIHVNKHKVEQWGDTVRIEYVSLFGLPIPRRYFDMNEWRNF